MKIIPEIFFCLFKSQTGVTSAAQHHEMKINQTELFFFFFFAFLAETTFSNNRRPNLFQKVRAEQVDAAFFPPLSAACFVFFFESLEWIHIERKKKTSLD